MKFKPFYGWYIVLGGMVMAAYNSWIFVYGWTAFINPIMLTFGWSMTQLSLASSLRGMQTGVFNPFLGRLVDRFSAQKLMLGGVIMTAIGVFMLSQTKNLGMYYAGFLVMGLGSSMVTGILPATVIARWFHKDLGKASGLFYAGNAIGGVFIFAMVFIVHALTWQRTLLYASIGYILLGIPLVFIYRSWPADKGLLPDGAAIQTAGGRKIDARFDFGTTVKEALKMRAFWHLVMVTLFQNAYLQVVQTFTIPYLTSIGMSAAHAATLTLVYTIISLFSRFPIGLLGDRLHRKSYAMAVCVALQAAGVFVFWLMSANTPFWLFVVFGLTYGVGISGIMTLRGPMIQEYFGVKNFGAIFGFTSVFITISGVLSAPLAGRIWDTQHTYKPFWLGGTIMGVLALIAILTMPAPRKREAPPVVTTPS